MNLRPPGYEPDELPAALLRDIKLFFGAENRGRTGTVLPPGDFKSPASAYSAIPASARQTEFKGGALSSAFDIGSGGRARTDSLPVNSRLLRH